MVVNLIVISFPSSPLFLLHISNACFSFYIHQIQEKIPPDVQWSWKRPEVWDFGRETADHWCISISLFLQKPSKPSKQVLCFCWDPGLWATGKFLSAFSKQKDCQPKCAINRNPLLQLVSTVKQEHQEFLLFLGSFSSWFIALRISASLRLYELADNPGAPCFALSMLTKYQ